MGSRERSLGAAVDDAALIRKLGEMFERVDAVPAEAILAARSAFAWRDMDAALARLVADEELEGAAVRADGDQRLMTFEAPGLIVAVEATRFGSARKLVGQLVPPGPNRVRLEAAAGGFGEAGPGGWAAAEPADPGAGREGPADQASDKIAYQYSDRCAHGTAGSPRPDAASGIEVEADHLGRFAVARVPAGPVRLRCVLPDGDRVVTEWVII
jgi:hypothetical protein